MDESWWNFGEVEKLFKERRKGKAKPQIELLLAKENGVGKLLLDKCGGTIHQGNGDVVWNAETLLELPLSKEFGRFFQAATSNTCSCSAIFLTLVSRVGGSNITSC